MWFKEGKMFHKSRFLHSLRVTLKKTLINYKGKMYDFWVIMIGRHHVIQVIKMIITTNGTNLKSASTNKMP